jgi:hypothetical protein
MIYVNIFANYINEGDSGGDNFQRYLTVHFIHNISGNVNSSVGALYRPMCKDRIVNQKDSSCRFMYFVESLKSVNPSDMTFISASGDTAFKFVCVRGDIRFSHHDPLCMESESNRTAIPQMRRIWNVLIHNKFRPKVSMFT